MSRTENHVRDRGSACEPLSPEDRMFLLCERRDVHMHLAATLVFDGGAHRMRDGGDDVARTMRYVESRLDRVPRYRQRLRHTPVDGEPVWVDDERFDVAYHVRHVPAPAPGDDAALKRLASRIISQPLDRSRPLWRMWIVTGLAGNRMAVVSKVHHCMADGVAGADLLAQLLTPHPVHAFQDGRPFVPRPAPSGTALLRESLRRRLRLPAELARGAARALARPAVAREWLSYGLGLCETVAAAVKPAPHSPFNRPIGPHRRFDWTAIELADVQAVRRRWGGSVNDVALATVTGALRRFLRERHPDSDLTDLRALVPVNVRQPDERGRLGNRVSAWLATLPVSEPDPRRRYEKIRRATDALKRSRQHLGGELLAGVGRTLLSLGLRLVERIQPFNLLVTSVPGPREPLYLLGSRLRYVYPEAPLFAGQGLGVALFSYAGTVCIGLHTDCHVVPDSDRLARGIETAFAELCTAAGAECRTGAPPFAAAG